VPDIDTPEQFGSLAPEFRLKVRNALLEHLELIDRFVAENPLGFSHEELEIVHSWRNLVAGKFYIFRYLARYSVFLTSGNEHIAYGVLALTQTFEELVGPYLPRLTETVLLPFGDRIVYDGPERYLQGGESEARHRYELASVIGAGEPATATVSEGAHSPEDARQVTRRGAPAWVYRGHD
jgi:hypothetical protein